MTIYNVEINPSIANEEVPYLREAIGWGGRFSDYPALFERCNFYAGVRNDQGTLIAFGYVCGMGLEHGYMEDIIVHPDYQRKMIGSQLVLALLKEAQKQNIGILTLSTDEETAPFYKKLGFQTEVSCLTYLN